MHALFIIPTFNKLIVSSSWLEGSRKRTVSTKEVVLILVSIDRVYKLIILTQSLYHIFGDLIGPYVFTLKESESKNT